MLRSGIFRPGLSGVEHGWLSVYRRWSHQLSRHEKLLNLGHTLKQLESAMPDLLQQTMPAEIVHQQIQFSVFPESYSVVVRGSMAYTALQKLIQMCVSPLLVASDTKLQILNRRLTKSNEVEDRRFFVHWRTVSPAREPSVPSGPLEFEPGRLIASLGLLPDEYPVLAGSFEFGFDSPCHKVLIHILRNVEYMAKPDSQVITST